MNLSDLRRQYHAQLCERIIRLSNEGGNEYPNFADRDNVSSRTIAWGIIRRMGYVANYQVISGQTECNEARAPYIRHASISYKWTLRSDRGQNARTEALNLIRNRKGHTPHIAAVTAEPLPTRIASLALGTGDLDCVYHFALPELQAAIVGTNNVDQMDMLTTLVDGKRLRDISDLPFDLIA